MTGLYATSEQHEYASDHFTRNDVVSNNPALFGKPDRIDWNTPECIWGPICEYFDGGIDLDPCTNEFSNVPANYKLTQNDNGLLYTWKGLGLIYCNPPYGPPIREWVKKGVEEEQEIIYLLPSRTDTQWFQYHFGFFTRVLFWQGRLKFDGAKDPAPFPSLMFYYGPRPEVFERAFAGKGAMIIPEKTHWCMQPARKTKAAA